MIETQRLFLREMTQEDFDALHAIFSDAETMAHYPRPFNAEDVRQWIRRNTERYDRCGFGLWAVVLKETGNVIGDCGLTLQQIDGKELPEIGYHIHRQYQRNGFAKEAAGAVRDWAFSHTNYKRLYSYMKYTSLASAATASAIGMTKIKTFPDTVNGLTYVFAIDRSVQSKRSISMKTAITIAGSDSGGGAGIQADIKTMTANGVFATCAVTALTAQNTCGVTDIMNVTPDFLEKQLDCVFTDICPDAVKIGMVSSGSLIAVIAQKLRQYHARNIVLDPVMVATSGSKLIADEAIQVLRNELIPLADVVTPNIPEAEVLTGLQIRSEADMEAAAKQICGTFGCAVLMKGGHSCNDANDLLCQPDGMRWFHGKRIDNPNTHGTGCTLSSAIAAGLAKGYPLPDAVALAKEYISGALSAMLDLGKGSGPMNHAFAIRNEFTEEYQA